MMTSFWRSLLFVPADRDDLLQKAPRCRPDGVIIDLEDSVAAEKKHEALQNISEKLSLLKNHQIAALVRVASVFDEADFQKIIAAQPAAIMLPKIKTAAEIDEYARKIKSPMNFIVLIEHPLVLRHIFDIAAMPSVIGLALGSEDFCYALNVPPSAEALDLPCRQIALAAAAHDKAGFGLASSIAAFGDLAAYRRAAIHARAIGLFGALCIHPAQVEIINQVFRPSQQEITQARQIITAWEAREKNSAVIAVKGQMVDAPVVARARQIIEQA